MPTENSLKLIEYIRVLLKQKRLIGRSGERIENALRSTLQCSLRWSRQRETEYNALTVVGNLRRSWSVN